MPPKTKLDNLPDNEHEMWEHAELYGNIVPELFVKGGEHSFVRRTAREVQCIHCDWGFLLDATDYLKDGHVYQSNGKLIV